MSEQLFKRIMILLAIVLVIETYYGYDLHSSRAVDHAVEIRKLKAKNAIEIKGLRDQWEERLYQATGSNPYERVFNRQRQSIDDLIKNLALASFPGKWTIEVGVEEFTHFILLLQPPIEEDVPDANQVAKYLVPVLKYSAPFLENIAVYTRNHMCYLYYDENVITKLIVSQELSSADVSQIWNYGRAFTRYNSVRIPYEKQQGHLFIPVTIAGDDGIKTEWFLLDTGASSTVISLRTAGATQAEDLNALPRESFSTANGTVLCPITKRMVSLGGIEKDLNVAVFPQDEQEQGLLGVDFFSDVRYTIDSQSNAIYVWEN